MQASRVVRRDDVFQPAFNAVDEHEHMRCARCAARESRLHAHVLKADAHHWPVGTAEPGVIVGIWQFGIKRCPVGIGQRVFQNDIGLIVDRHNPDDLSHATACPDFVAAFIRVRVDQRRIIGLAQDVDVPNLNPWSGGGYDDIGSVLRWCDMKVDGAIARCRVGSLREEATTAAWPTGEWDVRLRVARLIGWAAQYYAVVRIRENQTACVSRGPFA